MPYLVDIGFVYVSVMLGAIGLVLILFLFATHFFAGIGPGEILVKELLKGGFIVVRNSLRKRRVCLDHICILTEYHWRGSGEKNDRDVRAESSHISSPGWIHAWHYSESTPQPRRARK